MEFVGILKFVASAVTPRRRRRRKKNFRRNLKTERSTLAHARLHLLAAEPDHITQKLSQGPEQDPRLPGGVLLHLRHLLRGQQQEELHQGPML